jgi:hypothetical protein
MHGAASVRQNIDGSPVGGGDSTPAKEKDDKPKSSTPFTRTITSEPQ